MKNKIKLFFGCFLFLLLTISTMAKSTCTIYLNGNQYKPMYEPILKQNMLFVSIDDLCFLTYGHTNTSNKQLTFSLQNHVVKLSSGERIISLDNKAVILKHIPFHTNNVLYVPICVLDYLHYPYQFDSKNNVLTIEALTPLYRDFYYPKRNKLISSYRSISTYLPIGYSKTEFNQLLHDVKLYNQSIAFLDGIQRESLLTFAQNTLKEAPYHKMSVIFRDNTLANKNGKVGKLLKLPLAASVEKNTLTVQIGEDTISMSCLWSAYVPAENINKLDAYRSLDSTLLRIIYEYYRNRYDLKDDIFFTPAIILPNNKLVQYSHDVYVTPLHAPTTSYKVVVSHLPLQQETTFLVDIFPIK